MTDIISTPAAVDSRADERARLAADVEEFKRRGGVVKVIPFGVTSAPEGAVSETVRDLMKRNDRRKAKR